MAERNYSAGTVEALFMLSRGHCYEPSCRARVIQSTEIGWRITVQIAHIKGLNPGSARHDDEADEADLNHFRNLMLLCKPHHDQVDGRATHHLYNEGLLLEWKVAVEGDYAKDLNQLDWLTEEKLQDLMASAIAETHSRILSALSTVKNVGSETLALLKGFIAESFNRPYMDPEAVASLEYSARVLEHLPAHAELLFESSRGLKGLPDSTELLYASSQGLRTLPQYVEILFQASRELRDIPSAAETLLQASQKLGSLQDGLTSLSSTSVRLERMMGLMEIFSHAADGVDWRRLEGISQHLSDLERAANRLQEASADVASLTEVAAALEESSRNLAVAAGMPSSGAWSWNSFRWGIGACLVAVIVVLLAWALASGQLVLR